MTKRILTFFSEVYSAAIVPLGIKFKGKHAGFGAVLDHRWSGLAHVPEVVPVRVVAVDVSQLAVLDSQARLEQAFVRIARVPIEEHGQDLGDVAVVAEVPEEPLGIVEGGLDADEGEAVLPGGQIVKVRRRV